MDRHINTDSALRGLRSSRFGLEQWPRKRLAPRLQAMPFQDPVSVPRLARVAPFPQTSASSACAATPASELKASALTSWPWQRYPLRPRYDRRAPHTQAPLLSLFDWHRGPTTNRWGSASSPRAMTGRWHDLLVDRCTVGPGVRSLPTSPPQTTLAVAMQIACARSRVIGIGQNDAHVGPRPERVRRPGWTAEPSLGGGGGGGGCARCEAEAACL